MSEKWLVLSYFANVDGMACSHHIDDRLPFLQQQGVEVTLLSSTCGAPRSDVRHIRVASPAPSGLRYEGRHFFRRHRRGAPMTVLRILHSIVLAPFYLFEKLLVPLDSTWSWWLSGGPAAAWLAMRRRPAVIYSTGGPFSAHLAALLAARLSRVPLVVEMQDPLVHGDSFESGSEQRYRLKLEGRIFRRAQAVVFLTSEAAARAVARHGHKGKAHAIYPGAPPIAYQRTHSKPGDFFTLAHMGSLNGSRNLETTLAAIESLLHERPEMAATLRLRIAGNCGENVQREIAAFSRPDTIEIEGKIDRRQALEAMLQADVLLLIQNTSDFSAETIPSKVYEYLQTGRPILALVYRNIELKAMLGNLGHTAVQADDAAAVRAAILDYWRKWQAGALTNSIGPSPYTVQAAAAKLCEVGGLVQASKDDRPEDY